MTPGEPKLKPCPCCGGEPWYDEYTGASLEFRMHRTYWSVRCKSCDLRTPSIANPTTCVDIWNKRVAP